MSLRPLSLRLPLRLTARFMSVVDQAVYRLLQHAFSVAHNHVRCARTIRRCRRLLRLITPVLVVQVRRSEASAVQLHHGAQVRRDHRQRRQDHPLRPVAAFAEVLDHADAWRLSAPLLAARQVICGAVRAILSRSILVTMSRTAFGAHARREDIAPAVRQLSVAAPGECRLSSSACRSSRSRSIWPRMRSCALHCSGAVSRIQVGNSLAYMPAFAAINVRMSSFFVRRPFATRSASAPGH